MNQLSREEIIETISEVLRGRPTSNSRLRFNRFEMMRGPHRLPSSASRDGKYDGGG
jgi:hypothetical protein